MRKIRAVLLCLFISACFPAQNAAGTTGDSGEDVSSLSDALKVRAWVEPADEVVVTQQVRLVVEVSARTWFARGTQLENVELADAVVQQAEQFAINSTRHDKGVTWSVQQWTFFLYPLKEKTYRIPGIFVTASIADGKGRALPTKVRTRSLAFRAVIPEEMRGRGNWVATTRLAVREHYSVHTDKQEVGDAIERTIEIEADGLPAMMLPVFPDKDVAGLGIYEDPPGIIDHVNRGERVGRRVEHITYLVEKRGAYCIPARIYSWFNLHTGLPEEIRLPEKWLVTEGFEPLSSPAEGNLLKHRALLLTLVLLLGAGSLLSAGFMMLRRRKGKAASGSGPSEAALKRALKRAAKAGKQEDALRILYQWLDHFGTPGTGHSHWRQFLYARGAHKELECFNHCMSALYGPDTARTEAATASFQPCIGLLDRRAHAACHAGEKSASRKEDLFCELPLF